MYIILYIILFCFNIHLVQNKSIAIPKTHPTLHMSISGPYFLVSRSNSGQRYHSVTTGFVRLILI